MAELSTKINAATAASTLDGMKLLGIDGVGYKQFPASLFQPYDADLASIAALTTTTFGRSLLTQSNAAAARTTLGVAIGSDVQAYDATLAALAALADGGGVLHNNGSGTLSWLGKSQGGNGSGDAGLLAVYDASGILACTDQIRITGAGDTGIVALIAQPSATNYSLTLPQANAHLAVSPNSDGSLSLFNLSDIPTDAAGVLTSNGSGTLSWAPAGGGGGLTVGTTTITSGTSGRWLYNNGGVLGEIALGTGVATWLQTPTLANLNSAVSDADLAQLGANTFTGVQTFPGGSVSACALNFGDADTGLYTSAATSSLDFAVAGSRVFQLNSTGIRLANDSKDTIWRRADVDFLFLNAGQVTGSTAIGGAGYLPGVNFGSASGIRWTNDSPAATPDIILVRDSSGVLAHRNGSSSNALRVYNTWTSSTNFERLNVDWKTTANTCLIVTEKGSGGGTARELHLGTDALASIKLDTSGGIDFARLSTTTETITPDKTITLKIGGVAYKFACAAA